MFEMDDLYQIMDRGWSIQLECKGSGREYPMTFEAVATRDITDNMTDTEKRDCLYSQIHAVGETIDDIVITITNQIKRQDEWNVKRR